MRCLGKWNEIYFILFPRHFILLPVVFHFLSSVFFIVPGGYFIPLPGLISFLCQMQFHSLAWCNFILLPGAISFSCLVLFHSFAWYKSPVYATPIYMNNSTRPTLLHQCIWAKPHQPKNHIM